ncbi:MAG: PD40 domain-containing protein [Gemmatimonadota bacterium]|nr:MAG: PD40 domain-containing protein [Gemmatimonadota bacterium]
MHPNRLVRTMGVALIGMAALRPAPLRAQADTVPLPAQPPRRCESLIAFSSDRDGAPGIYVIDPDGGPARLVVSVPGALQIEWAPDGRRLAFLSVTAEDEELFGPFGALRFHAFLYTVNLDGTDLRRRGDYPMSMGFSWSPDGERIALASAVETGGQTALYVSRLDGSEWRRITDLDGLYMFPEWSADGRLIAFASRKGGDTALRVVSPEGKEERAVVEVSGSRAFRMFRPVWSPAGRMIAFAEGRDVFVVSAVEGTPQRIASGPGEPFGWSPSQRKLLLGEGAEGRGRVYIVDLDTLQQEDLARDAGAGGASSPSPEWDRVAYTAIRGEQAEVFVVGIDGGPPVNLTDHPANDYFPVWSPCLGP